MGSYSLIHQYLIYTFYISIGISEHQSEDSGGDNDALKLHNSLQSLREYCKLQFEHTHTKSIHKNC